MNRSIRCIHGMDRDLVACPACGDQDKTADAGNGYRRPSRQAVISRPHGQTMSGRERLMYARRERQAGR